MGTSRLTITIDADLLAELRNRVSPRELSMYVSEALRSRLRTDPTLELLDRLDEMYGPLTDDEIAQGEREWTEINERLTLTLKTTTDLRDLLGGHRGVLVEPI